MSTPATNPPAVNPKQVHINGHLIQSKAELRRFLIHAINSRRAM